MLESGVKTRDERERRERRCGDWKVV
jgi:hypothetical protein